MNRGLTLIITIVIGTGSLLVISAFENVSIMQTLRDFYNGVPLTGASSDTTSVTTSGSGGGSGGGGIRNSR